MPSIGELYIWELNLELFFEFTRYDDCLIILLLLEILLRERSISI